MDFTKFSTGELKKMLKERKKQLLKMTYVEGLESIHNEVDLIETIISAREQMNG